MSLPTILHSQTPKLFSHFSLYTPHKFSPAQTLSFSRKLTSISPSSLSPSFNSFTHQGVEVENEEEHVVGDCLVFEEGIFEDPYLQQQSSFTTNKPKTQNKTKTQKNVTIIEPQNLVPDKWRDLQEEINITKKERRKIAQQMEFGARVEKNRKGLIPLRDASYLEYKTTKLTQLKPLVLDNPSFPVNEEKKASGELKDVEMNEPSSSRVVPRNPRREVYGGKLEDISEFFSSGIYEPGNKAANEGRRKLFTKEEKVLLNRRIPDLAAATSGKWLPLHALAASGEFYLMNALLKHNVDINATDKDGATLMHYAVRTAAIHTIKILLLYDVDINLQDNDGWTPLHLAVQARRTDLVRLLLIKGADKTLKNQDGLTPLDLCLYSGGDTRTCELIKLLKQLPKAR